MHVVFLILCFHSLWDQYIWLYEFLNAKTKSCLPKISCFYFLYCLYYWALLSLSPTSLPMLCSDQPILPEIIWACFAERPILPAVCSQWQPKSRIFYENSFIHQEHSKLNEIVPILVKFVVKNIYKLISKHIPYKCPLKEVIRQIIPH